MKIVITGHLLVVMTVAICATILNSCGREEPVKVKVPDFATLSSQFSEPSAEYTTSPFFVWNAEITREEIDKFMEDFKKEGSSQVFIHPRPGLITEYLSQNWLELYQYTVAKGRELGMKVWIYDENSYPSGFAGGHVPDEMPESYNQGQGLVMTKAETLPDSTDKFYLCLKEDNGNYTDITSSLAAEKGKTGKYLLFSKTYNAKSDWYGGFSYVDLLLPGVTPKFIELTMTGYQKYIGSEFGKTVPGTFTDEPQIDAPGGIRWTPDLFDVFMKQWNYDLRTHLPSLYEETGDWKKVRHNYTETLLQLFIDRWAKPWHTWCNEHNIIFTGHYWEHDWPSIRHGGDNMAMYAWHQMPAIDMLFNQYNDSSVHAQFGNVRSVKELASAANQTGSQRKLSETYGGSGWDLTFTDMKRNGDWEYALGVNFMNQHLTYFTLAGARKYDYPCTFDYHEPWWNDYKYINDHYARLSLALSSGIQLNDIMVLEPTTSCWMYDSYISPNQKSTDIGQAFQSFITTLEKSQVEYDLGSENIMKDIASVSEGKLIVGKASYSRAVIPPMTENLNRSTFKLLEKFVSEGGTLIAFAEPTFIEGEPDESLKQFFKSNAGRIIRAENLTDDLIEKFFPSADISFAGVSGGTLYHHRRILTDGELLFFVNSSTEASCKGSFKTTGADAIEMNTLTGEKYGYPNKQNGNEITCSFSLPPAGSLLLFIPDTGNEELPVPSKPHSMSPVPSESPVGITRNEDNVLMIDFCDLEIGKEKINELNNLDASDRVFKYYGFHNGDPWNTSVQFKNNTVSRDTFGIGTGFKATYHFTVRGKFDFGSMKAVVERAGLWSVVLNGTEIKPEPGKWWLDRSLNVFNVGTLVRSGENTISLTVSPMKIHAEIEPVYILGDFSVVPAAKGFLIEAPALSYRLGSWKEQGLPFYSWGMTYSREYRIEKPEGKWEVSLPDWKGTVAEVSVNGESATVIAFPPYTTDVTSLIKPGMNKIDVRVLGSLKNLLGPHHNKPAPGFVTPWSWRNVKGYPAGKDYQMNEYGLMGEFVLSRGVEE